MTATHDGRIPVFVNAAAGAGAPAAEELEQTLGAEAVRVLIVDPRALASRIAAEVAAGAGIVAVAGGDGSLRTAAAALRGSRTALACVPTGTLNHFARRLGITSVADAAAALRARRIRSIAMGTVGDDVFLNTLTFGEYHRIVRIRERFRRYVGKWPAATAGYVVTVATLRRITLRMKLEDRELTRRTPFLWVGIGRGSFPRVHEAAERRSTPDLEIAVLRSSSARAGIAFLLRLGFRMLRGDGPVRDPSLEVLHGRRLVVDAPHRVDATADGEMLRLRTPVAVSVEDAALRVLTGSTSSAD